MLGRCDLAHEQEQIRQGLCVSLNRKALQAAIQDRCRIPLKAPYQGPTFGGQKSLQGRTPYKDLRVGGQILQDTKGSQGLRTSRISGGDGGAHGHTQFHQQSRGRAAGPEHGNEFSQSSTAQEQGRTGSSGGGETRLCTCIVQERRKQWHQKTRLGVGNSFRRPLRQCTPILQGTLGEILIQKRSLTQNACQKMTAQVEFAGTQRLLGQG